MTDEPTEKLTKAQAEAIANEQIKRWRNSREACSNDTIDGLMESQVAYQLLVDQAKMFLDVIQRIT